MELLEDCKRWATPNTISYSAAITACEKGEQQHHAVALLKIMCAEKIWPNTTSYSAAISACAHGKCWEQALELLQNCKMWATPNTISYNAAITACEKGGQQHHAVALLQSMCTQKIWPNATSYSAATVSYTHLTLPTILRV